jgi:hypothetical protein
VLFSAICRWKLNAWVPGFEWAALAIVLIFTTPVFLKCAPVAAPISVIAADIGRATLTLIHCGFIGLVLVSGWAFFVAGFFGIIMTIGGILGRASMKFSMENRS